MRASPSEVGLIAPVPSLSLIKTQGNMSRPANAAGFFIHAAVHKAREDVVAACHTHSIHGMAWSAFGRPVEMLTQDAAYLYGDAQAVYRDFGGVVLTEEEGDRIGAALGESLRPLQFLRVLLSLTSHDGKSLQAPKARP